MKHVRTVSRVGVCKAQSIVDDLNAIGTLLTVLASLITLIQTLSGSNVK